MPQIASKSGNFVIRPISETILEPVITMEDYVARKHFQVELNDEDSQLLDTYIETATSELEAYEEENVALKEIVMQITQTDGKTFDPASMDFTIPDARFVSLEEVLIDGSANIHANAIVGVDSFTIAPTESGEAQYLNVKYISGLGRKAAPREIQAILIQAKKHYDMDRSGYTEARFRETKVFETIGLSRKRIIF